MLLISDLESGVLGTSRACLISEGMPGLCLGAGGAKAKNRKYIYVYALRKPARLQNVFGSSRLFNTGDACL